MALAHWAALSNNAYQNILVRRDSQWFSKEAIAMNWGLMLIAVIVGIGIFVLSRELALWSWRLGEMANNLAYIANHYRLLDQAENRRRAELQYEHETLPTLARRPGRYPGISEPPSSFWSNN
jgi:hypothetical protein